MTPTDPDFVQRLRSFVEWRDAHSISGPYQDLLTESLAALDAAEARVQQLEAALKDVNDCRAALVGRADTQEPTP